MQDSIADTPRSSGTSNEDGGADGGNLIWFGYLTRFFISSAAFYSSCTGHVQGLSLTATLVQPDRGLLSLRRCSPRFGWVSGWVTPAVIAPYRRPALRPPHAARDGWIRYLALPGIAVVEYGPMPRPSHVCGSHSPFLPPSNSARSYSSGYRSRMSRNSCI